MTNKKIIVVLVVTIVVLTIIGSILGRYLPKNTGIGSAETLVTNENAPTIITNDSAAKKDILLLYKGDDSERPVWRWNSSGGAIVRTWLAITGDHNLHLVGGYSSMLGVRSDLSAGAPAFVVQTNTSRHKIRGPLMLGLDWDNTLTFALQPEGTLQTSGIMQTNLSGEISSLKAPRNQTLYSALVGSEVGLYFRGTGRLIKGEATIYPPEHFSQFVSSNGITVHLTPLNGWLQIYTTDKTPESITVREASDKTGEFDYIIYGVRKGYEDYQPIKD